MQKMETICETNLKKNIKYNYDKNKFDKKMNKNDKI